MGPLSHPSGPSCFLDLLSPHLEWRGLGPSCCPSAGPDVPFSPRARSGMELFEEALQKWEQALSVGQRGDSDSTPTRGDGLRNPETASEALSEVGGSPLGLSHPRPWWGPVLWQRGHQTWEASSSPVSASRHVLLHGGFLRDRDGDPSEKVHVEFPSWHSG